MTRRSVLALLASVVLAPVALTACGTDDDVAAPVDPPSTTAGPTPTLSPTPAPAPTTPAPERLDAVDWRTPFREGQPFDLHRVGDGYVGLETRGVSGLTDAGRVRWHWTPPTKGDVSGALVGDVVVMDGDTRTTALDAGTGHELWSAPSNGWTTQDDRRVFLTTCVGGRADGSCTLAARDVRSGAVLWTTPLGGFTENTQVVGGHVVVQTFRDAHHTAAAVVDAASGAITVPDLAPDVASYEAVPVGDRVAVLTSVRTAGACPPTVTTYDHDGRAAWSTTIRGAAEEPLGKRCDPIDIQVTGADGAVVVNTLFGPTFVLDGRTGKVRFHVGGRTTFEGSAPGVVVLQDGDDRSNSTYDVPTGKKRWTVDETTGGWIASGRYLAGNVECDDTTCNTLVLDVRTGKQVLKVAGVPEAFVAPRRPGGRLGLLARIDDPQAYRSRYTYVTLPPLAAR